MKCGDLLCGKSFLQMLIETVYSSYVGSATMYQSEV